MATANVVYGCTESGLAIFNKPGTLNEWLPPRLVLQGQRVSAAWAEPGPPTRVLAIADNHLMASETGGRLWQEAAVEGSLYAIFSVGERMLVLSGASGLSLSTDGGVTWAPLPLLPLDGRVVWLGGHEDRTYLLTESSVGHRLLGGDLGSGKYTVLPVQGVDAVALGQRGIYVAADAGVLESRDGG
ncbi:MAG: hypothetical protein M3014_12860, partial [Chloroflexota bacterium]|nr:hypothetical protein [Chloroflexota bacterium]